MTNNSLEFLRVLSLGLLSATKRILSAAETSLEGHVQ